MFLVLTNAAEAHHGSGVAIKKDIVVGVHTATEEKDGIVTQKTYVFCPPHGTWEVQETFKEVIAQLTK